MNKIVLGVCSLQYDSKTVPALMNIAGRFQAFGTTEGCLLPQARNKCINTLLKNDPDFTHLIFIDDDMTDFTWDHVQKLVDADKDIISALMTFRRPPYTIVSPILNGQVSRDEILKLIKDETILETDFVGMGFTCIKRSVIDKIKESTPDGPVWFTMDREPRDSFQVELSDKILEWKRQFLDNENQFNKILMDAVMFGRCAHLNSSLKGEDILFSKRARMFGFKCFVHCGVVVGHVGTQVCSVRDTLKFSLVSDLEMDYNKSVEKGDIVCS